MKKALTSILILIYVATSSGFAVYMHYCMGKVDSVDIFKSNGCAKCGMKTDKNCCKEESKVVKLKDTHQAKSNTVSLLSPFKIISTAYKQFPEPVYPNASAIHAIRNNSPPFSGYDRCIINSVFRI